MRKFTCLLIALMSLHFAIAQGTVKGKLMDSTSKTTLGLATVSVFTAADTSLITYRLSNPEGIFNVPGVPVDVDCRLVVSYSGYEAFRHEFKLTGAEPLDLGTIYLEPTARSLDEILVIAERPPVTVKKDTIEFNANSFKTLPTALVEDLLKKLPGVQVESDGSITANGKRVNRILVDGKAFFGDDPKMATRNLPANVIDKVQVADDQEEANRNINGDLTNVGQVINLTLKKGVKKGWFGKVYAGAGTADRYEAGGIANIYRDTLQLSLLAFSNNMNRSGFSFKEVQDLGGFNRSGSNSMMMMSRGGQSGFSINGISFGGLDLGISQTSGAGFNLNHAPNKNNSFFLQYFYGKNNNTVDMLNNVKQFINDTSINNLTVRNSERDVNTHNLSAGFKLNPDSLTNIELRSYFSYSGTDETSNSNVTVNNNQKGLVSTGVNNQYNNNTAKRYNHNLFLTRRSGTKKGRSWNINNYLSIGRTAADYISESVSQYFDPNREVEFNQLRRLSTPTLSTNTNIGYADPLSSRLTFRFNNRHEYVKDENDITTFYQDPTNWKYELLNYNLSSGFQREQNRFSSYAGFNYKIKQVTLSAGLSGLWQNIENRFKNISVPVSSRLFNLLPSASFQWKQLSANYSMNVNAPGINYLIPVPDSTNPFNIRFGNPYLNPSRQHNIYVSNFNFFRGSGSTFNIWLNGNFTDNDVILSRSISANGVQTERPVNANGSISMHGGIGYGKEFKNNQKFIFSFRVSPNGNFDRRKLLVNNVSSTATTFGYGPNINIGLNWNDIVEFRPAYSPRFSKTTYTDPNMNDIKVVTQYMEGELIVRWPKKLVWESNIAYRKNSQAAPGLPATNLLWNAAVTLLMFKGDVGLLKLSVFDLLDRNTGYFQYTSQNQIIDQQSNTLKRFAALSFTYNIRNMGAPKKVGGRDRLFMF